MGARSAQGPVPAVGGRRGAHPGAAERGGASRLGLAHDAPVCVYVSAGGGPEAGLLLPVVERVTEELPDACFVFVGPRDASRSGMAGVLDTGPVPPGEVQWWVAAADVALLPYFDSEFNRARWPIKLGEYIAAGRPVVACDIGELGRVVAEHELGLLARPDMSDFAERVLELLRDPRRAAEPARGRVASPKSIRLARPRRTARGVPVRVRRGRRLRSR